MSVSFLFNRCARAVKAEWKSADDLLNFWSTDYGDDAALKQLLMKKLDPKKDKKKLADKYIKLRVVHVLDNSEIFFRLKKNTPFWRLRKSFAERVGQPESSLDFYFKDKMIRDDETPMSLQMKKKNVNIIRVFLR